MQVHRCYSNLLIPKGGALPDSEVTWTVVSSEASFTPPGWSKYHFSATHAHDQIDNNPKYPFLVIISNAQRNAVKMTKTLKGSTTETGLHSVKIQVIPSNVPWVTL